MASPRMSGSSPFVGEAGAPQPVVEAECTGGACLAVLEGHARSVKCLALSADGTLLLTGGNDGVVCAWALSNWAFVGAWEGHAAAVLCLGVVAHSGLLLSGAQDGQLRLWDAATPGGAATLAVAAHTGAVHSLKVGAAGGAPLVATGGADACVRLWRPDAAGCPCVWLLRAHTGPVFGLAFAGDTLVSASHDSTGALWRLSGCPSDSSAAPPPAPVLLRGHDNGLNDALCVSSDGRRVWTASNDATVRGWATASGACEAVLTGHTRSVLCLALSSDDSALYSGSSDGDVRAWRTEDGTPNHVMRGHKGAVYSLALARAGGLLFSGAYDDCIRGWATAYGACVCLLRGHANLVNQLLLAPDDITLFSGSADSTARAWTVAEAPPLPRVGRAPVRPYASGPSVVEEQLAAAMGQLGAYVPALPASPKAPASPPHRGVAEPSSPPPTTSPSASVTLKPGRDGRARLQAVPPQAPPEVMYYSQPPEPEAVYEEEQPLPPLHAQVLAPRAWAAAAAAAAEAVAEAMQAPPEEAAALEPYSDGQYGEAQCPDEPPPPPPASGLPPYVAPASTAGGQQGPGLTASLLSSPLKPDRKGGAARHPPLAGAADVAPSAADDFATRLHAARSSGVQFIMPAAMDPEAVVAPTSALDPASAPTEAPAAVEGEAAAAVAVPKAVAEGNGDASNDFVARMNRARSSGAFSASSQ